MSVGAQRLRDEPQVIRQGAIDKGEDPATVDRALAVDASRRTLLGDGDRLKAARNAASKQIAEAIRAGASPGGPEVAGLRRASTEAGTRIEKIDGELAAVEAELEDLLLRIPNPADPDVPVGDRSANRVVRTWGERLSRAEATGAGAVAWTRQPHWDIAERLKIIDLARGAKITGSGFPVYLRAGSAMQRALIDFFLDVHAR